MKKSSRMLQYSLLVEASFSRIMHPATLQKMNVLRNRIKEFKVLTWSTNSPYFNLIKHRWIVLEKEV